MSRYQHCLAFAGRTTIVGFAVVLLLGAEVAARAGEPSEAVRPFYLQPGLELGAEGRERFVDPGRKVLEQDALIRKDGDEGCLDPALPFDDTNYDAAEVTRSLQLGEVVKGDNATVVAAFTAEGATHRVQWLLKNVGGAWKISDIISMTKDFALSAFQCE